MIGERNKFCYAATWVGVRNLLGQTVGAETKRWAMWRRPTVSSNFQCTGDHNTCTEGFSSNHCGGAFFAFCDASVHFINDDISFDDLIGLGTPPQIDSDSAGNSSVCYANPATKAGASLADHKLAQFVIGVYQRLAWRNDVKTIDSDAF